MDGLTFLNSYWQFVGGNVKMVKCDAASLILELKYLSNINIDKCTFGNWTFRQAKQAIIKNSRNSINKEFSTSLSFYNSSGLMENITIMDLNSTKFFEGLVIQNNSYIKITKSNFVNNIVSYGLIKVFNSSTLEMSDCILLKNQAREDPDVILHTKAVVYDSATCKAISCKFPCKNCSLYKNQFLAKNYNGGYLSSCISTTSSSVVFIYESIFSKNIGSTISLTRNSHLVVVSSHFFNNTTYYMGGAILSINSTLDISHSIFYQNKGHMGSALGMQFSTAVVHNCTFNNHPHNVFILVNYTRTSIVNCIFQNNSSPKLSGALYLSEFSIMNVSNTTFLKNSGPFGGAILVSQHSFLMLLNCSFSSNTALFTIHALYPNKNLTLEGEGGAVCIFRSVLKGYWLQFSNNYAHSRGGSVYSMNSSLWIHNTTFENNTAGTDGGAIFLSNHSSLVIVDSFLTNNSILDKKYGIGGSLAIQAKCTVIISSVHLVENIAQYGGAIYVGNFCKITILVSLFVANTKFVIFVTDDCMVLINNSQFFENSEGAIGASTSCVINVTDTVFNHNTANSGGSFYVMSSNISLYNCLCMNNSAFKGGVLFAINSNIQIIASNFTRNSAINGGVFTVTGNLLVVYSIMNNNTAKLDGGVGYLGENSHINITAGVFKANSAHGNGGVLRVGKGNVSVLNSSFEHNWAFSDGGVIDLQYSSVINISETIFFGNKGGGGGVLSAAKNTTVFVDNSKILQNSAVTCGAILAKPTVVLEINLSQIHRNYANKAGAFCAFNNSLLIFKNSIFKENTGYTDRSIALYSSTGYLENCTLIGNHGAISIKTSELRLSNTVFSQNMSKGDVADIDSKTALTKLINRIYTYQSLMKHGNITLKSNATNFKQIAMENHFLKETTIIQKQSNLATEETQFASGEILCVTFFATALFFLEQPTYMK